MKIAVVGTGYVGLMTAAGLAQLGHKIVALDINKEKINKLKKGHLPFFEPGLKKLVINNLNNGRLVFDISLNKYLEKIKYIFICVGTPPKKDGSADLRYVRSVAEHLGKTIKNYKIIINKSTVPVGSGVMIKSIIKKNYNGNFDVISCPEFLREGKAVWDFFHPDRLVVGGENQEAIEGVISLFNKIKTEKVKTTLETAELIKYAANAFLATKISFINEIANLCDKVKANIDDVALGMGLDKRIGSSFLKAGMGYGGSCFPKDVRALKQLAGGHGYKFHLLKAVIEINRLQKLVIIQKIKAVYNNLKNKRITVLGLAFKENTDDIRESGAMEIVKILKRKGAIISVYDPEAMDNAKKELDGVIKYCRDPYQACLKADLLIIATEWPQFKRLSWSKIKRLMKFNIIIDGKNLLDKDKMEKLGYKYYSVGRN